MCYEDFAHILYFIGAARQLIEAENQNCALGTLKSNLVHFLAMHPLSTPQYVHVVKLIDALSQHLNQCLGTSFFLWPPPGHRLCSWTYFKLHRRILSVEILMVAYFFLQFGFHSIVRFPEF